MAHHKDRCECGHARSNHMRSDRIDCQVCDCKEFVLVEKFEEK